MAQTRPDGIRSRRGYTLIELIPVLLTIAVLCGLLLPAVAKVREAARRKLLRDDPVKVYVALKLYQSDLGNYPRDLRDPLFQKYLIVTEKLGLMVPGFHRADEIPISEGVQLADLSDPTPVLRRVQDSLANPYASPYYIWSPRFAYGSKDIFDFRLVVGLNRDPRNPDVGEGVADTGFGLRPTYNEPGDNYILLDDLAFNAITRDYFYSDASGDDANGTYRYSEYWYWDTSSLPLVDGIQPDTAPYPYRVKKTPKPPAGLAPVYQIGNLQWLAASAELVAPLLSEHPELIGQIRGYAGLGANVAGVLALVDADHDGFWSYDEVMAKTPAPLAALYALDPSIPSDSLPLIAPGDLAGRADLLFSPDGLKALAVYYCPDKGVLTSLHAKIDARSYEAFRNEVRAQSGKKISAKGAETLTVLSRTL